MRNLHALTVVGVLVTLLGISSIVKQREGTQAAEMLTGADIAEIQQLYARYNQGLDFGDKELFMSAFADDAVYTTGGGEVYSGKEGLTEWVTPILSTGPPTVIHNNTSVLITPTSEGAKGRGYWILMNVEQREPAPMFSGYYEDTFIKTAKGWRIKTRGSVRGWASRPSQ